MEITEKHAQLFEDGYSDEARESKSHKGNLKRIVRGLGIVLAVMAIGFAVWLFFTTDWKTPELTVLLLAVIAIELAEINRKLGKASK